MAAIIKIENLYKVYPVGKEKVVALGGISLEIEKGQICCILGTSGSGKSTLLNQLAGLEKPSKGRVLIGGVNISTLSEGQLAKFRQKNVGFIFQSYNLLPNLTATENVALPLMFRGVPKAQREAAARKLLTRVGLAHRLDHFPRQMSGGQQQRATIGRAIANRPKVLIADEPTGNLDPEKSIEIMELLERINEEEHTTILMVTHSAGIGAYGNRILVMDKGCFLDDKYLEGTLPDKTKVIQGLVDKV